MASKFSRTFLFVFLLNFFLTIQELQRVELLSKEDINIIDDDSLTNNSTRLVQKRVRLPFVVDSGPPVKDRGHYAGYYDLPHTIGARMFYFFESRTKKSDPVVIWLAGGPGCGGEIALFYENGPFHIEKNGSLVWNDYGWDKVSNLLYVDQPTGTGFSYTTNDGDLRQNQIDVTNDLYDFLQKFFTEYSHFKENDFFITGESYAGHYAPALASKIIEENKNKKRIHINLQGFAIGNGLVNPGIQFPEQLSYALSQTLIESTEYTQIKKVVRKCKSSIKARETGDGHCLAGYDDCQSILDEILSVAGNINVRNCDGYFPPPFKYYDIRKDCEGTLCYDFSDMEKLMNEKSMKESLGVGDDNHFVSCLKSVLSNMKGDFMKNYDVGIPALLENGIKVLIYAGDQDLLVNWQGNLKWVLEMKWFGKESFKASRPVDLVVDGDKVWQLRSHRHLSFVKIYKAGHLVPMDQPKAALQMIEAWMQDRLSVQL